MPQETSERKVVPIPKQITRAFFGDRGKKARGRWAMVLVMGVRWVMATLLTHRRRALPVPPTPTAA